MLYLNIKRLMRIRGIDNHYKFILDLGFAPATVRNLLSNAVWRINFDHLEKFCLALNCTPNDILQWQPPDNQANAEAQALIKLKRDPAEDLPKLLSSLPMEKFDEIIGIIQDLKKEQE